MVPELKRNTKTWGRQKAVPVIAEENGECQIRAQVIVQERIFGSTGSIFFMIRVNKGPAGHIRKRVLSKRLLGSARDPCARRVGWP